MSDCLPITLNHLPLGPFRHLTFWEIRLFFFWSVNFSIKFGNRIFSSEENIDPPLLKLNGYSLIYLTCMSYTIKLNYIPLNCNLHLYKFRFVKIFIKIKKNLINNRLFLSFHFYKNMAILCLFESLVFHIHVQSNLS